MAATRSAMRCGPGRPPLRRGLPFLAPGEPVLTYSAVMDDFDWVFPYPSQRMPVLARNIVATSQPLAAQAGLQLLRDGGNAADAAVATALGRTVIEPTSHGIRSDRLAPGSAARGLRFRATRPGRAGVARVSRTHGFNRGSPLGPLVTIPGTSRSPSPSLAAFVGGHNSPIARHSSCLASDGDCFAI